MDAKISDDAICVKAIIYLLLYNLHDYTFNVKSSTYYFHMKVKILADFQI